MDLTLSWDLIAIIFAGVVITYSLIIGKHQSIKVIISSYIAIVAAQGLGNLLARFSDDTQPLLTMVGVDLDITLHAGAKMILFVIAIVFLASRGGFEIEYDKETGSVTSTILTVVFGLVTAGLLLSTLMTFVANAPLLDTSIADHDSIKGIMKDSQLMKMLIVNQDIFFALPAIVLLSIGFLSNKRN